MDQGQNQAQGQAQGMTRQALLANMNPQCRNLSRTERMRACKRVLSRCKVLTAIRARGTSRRKVKMASLPMGGLDTMVENGGRAGGGRDENHWVHQSIRSDAKWRFRQLAGLARVKMAVDGVAHPAVGVLHKVHKTTFTAAVAAEFGFFAREVQFPKCPQGTTQPLMVFNRMK